MAKATPARRFRVTLRMAYNKRIASLCAIKHKATPNNKHHTVHWWNLKSHRLSHPLTLTAVFSCSGNSCVAGMWFKISTLMKRLYTHEEMWVYIFFKWHYNVLSWNETRIRDESKLKDNMWIRNTWATYQTRAGVLLRQNTNGTKHDELGKRQRTESLNFHSSLQTAWLKPFNLA